MKLPTETLKKILVGSGFVNEAEFDDAATSAAELGKKLEEVLIFRGLISEESFSKLIADYLKVPFIDIGDREVSDEILALIPEKLARSYRMIPFAKEQNQLRVAMSAPTDFEALEFAKRQTGFQIVPYYASSEDIRRALGQYKRNIRSDFDKVISENVKKASAGGDLSRAAEELPVIKILDTILGYSVAERASDIHIETLADGVVIRFRIDGILKDIIKLPLGIEDALVARIKILSNLKIDEHRIPQDGRYKFNIDDDIIALRVSIIPGFYKENVVTRLLPETSRPLSLGELGISGENLKRINNNLTKPNGMVLVTGPTGSGKTTSLYSVLNILNTVRVKIITIEDPIEYGIKRVSQIQVNPKAGLTFANGLRSILRHDPDIIMVGEIRDKETAEISVHSALTGHLVLSTLHTNDAAGAIPRFTEMGVEEYLLASTLNLVVAQRLVRKICKSCLVEYMPDQKLLAMVTKNFQVNLENQKYYKGQGCKECHGSGYSGRIGIYEALAVSEKIRELITTKASGDNLTKQAITEGMVTMFMDGLDKVSSGTTTLEEVLKAVREN